MSYDFALQKMCNHRVFREVLPIDADTNTQVSIPRPISNGSVEVFVDDIRIPSHGLYSSPSIPFSKPGPYRFVSGKSDLLYVAVGNKPARYVQLLTGSNLSAEDVAKDLTTKVTDLSFGVSNGRVVVTNPSPVGLVGFTFVDPVTYDKLRLNPVTDRVLGAYSNAGIVPGRVVSSHRVYPGWTLRKNIYTCQEEIKAIYFDYPLPNQNPVVRVSYSTIPQYCRRCVGSSVEYDYQPTKGTYLTVQNGDLLYQEFDKYLFTSVGSHYKWRWIGSSISEKIGGKSILFEGAVSGLVSLDVSNTFKTYANIKSQQLSGFPQQKVSDEEYPGIVSTVNSVVNPDDPTVTEVDVTITDKNGKSLTISRIFGVPNPLSITNSPSAAIQNSMAINYKLRA